MHVAAAISATLLVILLVFVQPVRGKRRFTALVEQVRVDPRARVRFYRRGIAAQWVVVAAVGVIGLLASMGPTSIRLTWHHTSSSASSVAFFCAAVGVLAVAASVLIIQRSGPKTINRLRKQVRGFVELLPRSTQERRTFVAVAVTAGICEEIVYRGFGIAYVKWLAPSASQLAVILIIGAAFGAAHVYQGPRNVVVTGILGALLTWLTLVTGTLLPAIAIHTAIDLRVALLPQSVTEPYEPTEAEHDVVAPAPVGWIHVAAGVLVIAGSLLPWISVSTGLGPSLTRNAFQLGSHAALSYDGIVLVACGALLVIAGASTARGQIKQRGRPELAVLLLSLLALLVALNKWSGLRSVVNLDSGAFVTASFGIGYYLVVLGSLAGIVGSLLLGLSRKRHGGAHSANLY
jgi:membrane protease YdiL (CAAX protease family)